MKKIFITITAILLLATNITCALSKTMFDRYWKPGEYTVELSNDEISIYSSIFESALKKSEGTSIRKTYDNSSYQDKYENYLSMIKDDPLPEFDFDDVGHYGYVVGIPNEKSISQEQALFIAYHALQEQYDITNEDLTHYLPFFTYCTYDAENPTWAVSFMCYDASTEIGLDVYVYAYDNCVQGTSKTSTSYG